MRHSKKFNHLGRTSSHRKAMLANMANSLIFHKRITTTLAKAKALRVYVEPLITKAKDDATHSRRTVFEYLQSKTAVSVYSEMLLKKWVTVQGDIPEFLKQATVLVITQICVLSNWLWRARVVSRTRSLFFSKLFSRAELFSTVIRL